MNEIDEEEIDLKDNEENVDTDKDGKIPLSEDEDMENEEEYSLKEENEIVMDSNSNNGDQKDNLDANKLDENGESETEGDINEDNCDSDGVNDEEILAAMQLSVADMGDNMKDNRGVAKNKAVVNGNHNHEKQDDDDMTVKVEPVEVCYKSDMDFDKYPLDGDDKEYKDELDQDNFNGDGIGVDENTRDFLDKVNGGLIAQPSQNSNYEKQKRASRGPYKKTRISCGLDTTITKSEVKVTTYTKVEEVYFKCERCSFTCECLGELKVHMFDDYVDQEKPSYLDLAEVAIVKLNKNWGTSRSSILAEILTNPIVTDIDAPDVAKKKLDRALSSGVQMGRLRTKQSIKRGNNGYWIVGKFKRKELVARYTQNKEEVDYKDIEIIPPEKYENSLHDDVEHCLSIEGSTIKVEDDIDEDDGNNKFSDYNLEENVVLCDVCPFMGTSRDVHVHKKKEHLGVKYPCDMCDFGANWIQNLKRHKKTIHFIDEQEIDPLSRDNKIKLKVEKRKLLSLGNNYNYGGECSLIECNKCGFITNSEDELRNHIKSIHSDCDTKAPMFQCKLCESSYKFKGGLTDHIKLKHTENQPMFKCDKCEYTSIRPSKLKEHKAIHREGELHCCEFCQFETYRKQTLKTHIKSVHLGILLACNECEFQCKSSSNLKRHVKINHLGIRYKCQYCDLNATDKYRLKDHIQSVHEGKKFNCDFCEYSTSFNSNVRKHMKAKHQNTILTSSNSEIAIFPVLDPPSSTHPEMYHRATLED